MKLAAALAVAAAALVLPAANAAQQQRVLGIDTTVLGMRLAWYDPATLTRLPGRAVALANHDGWWSFSPDGKRLAIGSEGAADLRFVDVRKMRVLGHVASRTGIRPGHVRWLSAHRLLTTGKNVVAVIDPQRLRVVRRTTLPGVVNGGARLPEGLALLLGQDINGFAPAKVAVVDAEGRSRSVTLDRISIGFFHSGDQYEDRRPGFTVDASTRRAFVVGADYTIAEVDLRTLAVTYHGGSERSPAKVLPGPVRNARWLGNGLLAIAGSNAVKLDGLRIVDTRDWSTRIVDAESFYLTLADGVLVGSSFWVPPEVVVYGLDGALHYRMKLEGSGTRFSVSGRYGYVCSGASLSRVIELASGATLRQVQAQGVNGPACATLLYGQSLDSKLAPE
jgi:hypothetical protein